MPKENKREKMGKKFSVFFFFFTCQFSLCHCLILLIYWKTTWV